MKKIQNKSNLKSRLFGIIFLTWFIGSLVGMIVLGQINGYYAIMIFGQYFLVFGIIPFTVKGDGKWMGIPFLLVGLACIIVPFLMMHPEILSMEIDWDRVIPILMMSAFVIAGLCMTFIPIFRFKYLKKVCSLRVYATVTGHNTMRSDKNRKLYAPVYEFEFNGNKYEVFKEEYTNVGVVPKGSIVELLINPDNPKEFLDNSIFSKGLIFLGILFLIVAVPILYLMISRKLL